MPDCDYTYSSGTSAATAYVTGVAALVISCNPNFTSIQIAEILTTSVKSIPSLKEKIKSSGIIDSYSCLKAAEKY